MTNQNSKSKDNQQRFSQAQYDMLKRCSEKKDMTEWNEWRKKHPDEDILLEGANLQRFYLEWAYLNTGTVVDDNTNKRYELSGEVHLENANFISADLKHTRLISAHLEGAKFSKLFDRANLQEASLGSAYLQGTRFDEALLGGADFRLAVVDGSTSFWKCKVNKHRGKKIGTNFEGVALGNVRIDARTKQLLEYNIRRKNWEWWYEEGNLLKWILKKSFIWPFWLISDYGLRTWRIILTFFALAIAFAIVYWLSPNCIMVNKVVGDIRGFWHALYFSIVTMTTLGFGDIAANPDSWLGQTLLMIQVILGYVLLGALITRFAVLFTAGGPAGKFSDEKKQKLQKRQRKE